MKKLKLIPLLVAAALAFAGVSASAQEDNNRDENGKIVRGPYETNDFGSNWFVSLGGGFNWAMDGIISKDFSNGFGGNIEVMAGKWFTPCFGARFGWQGLMSRIDIEEEKTKFNYDYLHGDLLWNLSNQIGGYKETRLYNAIPYAHFGMFVGNGNEFGCGAGLLNNFRINNHWLIFADLRGTIVRGEQFNPAMAGVAGAISLAVGVTYNIGKCTWTRAADGAALTAAAEAAKAALAEAEKALKDAEDNLAKAEEDLAKAEDDNKALADANDELEQKLKDAENRTDTVYVNNASELGANNTFYFELGKTELSESETDKVKEFVANADKDRHYVLAGFADKATGTPEINSKLAYQRALNVGYLFIKYGMDPDHVRAALGGELDGDQSQSRVVAVFEE